nr:stalk domain-containing protein [uncultured Agathobaculum sp.]
MKHFWKLVLLSLTLSAAAICGAGAAGNEIPISDPNAQIYVQGVPVLFPNERGEYMPAISYQDSTYMPVRSAGEWMGKTVGWDGTTQTITLSGSVDSVIHGENEAVNGSVFHGIKEGTAVLCPERKVYLDGELVTFRNEKGTVIYPIDFLNVTYLPVRSIGELTGMDVKWVGRQSNGMGLIFLRTPLEPDEQSSLRNYAANLQTAAEKLYNISESFRTAVPAQVVGTETRYTVADQDKAQTALTEMQQQITEMQQLCQSDSTLVQYYQNEIISNLKSLYTASQTVSNMLMLNDVDTVIEETGVMGASLPVVHSGSNTVLRMVAHMREVIGQTGFIDPFTNI